MPKKSSFLEMAGVELGEPAVDIQYQTTQPSVTEEHTPILGSIKNLFSTISLPTSSYSHPPSYNNTPDTSHHTHSHSHSMEEQVKINFEDVLTQKMNIDKEGTTHVIPSPPQSQSNNNNNNHKQPKVKEIVQEIESKPKKDTSNVPPPNDP
jgi:hypothetical protein